MLVAITLGVVLGYFDPPLGVEKMKPLGDGFIKLIRMMIAPVIFTTVVTGIAGMGDMKKLGRVGIKALLYFEVVTTAALIIGLVIVTIVQPGDGHQRGSRIRSMLRRRSRTIPPRARR